MSRQDFQRLRPGQQPASEDLNQLFDAARRASRAAGAPGANVANTEAGLTLTDNADEQFRAIILPDSGIGAQQAAAIAVLDPSGDGQITGISITFAGSGYSDANPPSVVFSPDDNGNVPQASVLVVSGAVQAVVLTNQTGIFYSSPPTVTIAAPSAPSGSTTGPNYAWQEVTVSPQGQTQIIQGGRNGTIGQCPAWEENGFLGVPANTVVWLRVGQYSDGNPDYRFFNPTLIAPAAQALRLRVVDNFGPLDLSAAVSPIPIAWQGPGFSGNGGNPTQIVVPAGPASGFVINVNLTLQLMLASVGSGLQQVNFGIPPVGPKEIVGAGATLVNLAMNGTIGSGLYTGGIAAHSASFSWQSKVLLDGSGNITGFTYLPDYTGGLTAKLSCTGINAFNPGDVFIVSLGLGVYSNDWLGSYLKVTSVTGTLTLTGIL